MAPRRDMTAMIDLDVLTAEALDGKQAALPEDYRGFDENMATIPKRFWRYDLRRKPKEWIKNKVHCALLAARRSTRC